MKDVSQNRLERCWESMDNKSNKQRKQERFDDNLAHWIAYWRANPHRFVTEYLMGSNGIFLFQKILLYFMFKSELFMFIAARGLGENYNVARLNSDI